jgi:hypothetical protein
MLSHPFHVTTPPAGPRHARDVIIAARGRARLDSVRPGELRDGLAERVRDAPSRRRTPMQWFLRMQPRA